MSKKQRLESGVKVTHDNGTPAVGRIRLDDILRQTRDGFVTAVMDDCFDGGTTACISQEKADAINEKLKAAQAKLDEMSAWMMECRIQFQREDRVRRKVQWQEGLQAIYRPESNDNTTCDSSDHVNMPLFNAESATALLDSGFLSAGDAGKLFLMTGKFFFSSLSLDTSYVWKRIFEAKFNYNTDHGLGSLLQSNKFEQILHNKGYEWVFRNFFARRLPQEPEGGLSIRETQQKLLPPPSALNCQNIFFIVLIAKKDEFGFCNTIHAQVLDNEDQIEKFLVSENQYEITISCKETLERVKQPFMHHRLLFEADIINPQNLEKKIRVHPEQFASGLLQVSGYFLADAMFCPKVTVLALRMDTSECTIIYDRESFEYYDYYDHDAGAIKYHASHSERCEVPEVPLNHIGKELMYGIYFDDGNENEIDADYVSLDPKVSIYFDDSDKQFCLGFSGWCQDYMETGMNLYSIMDYGLDWEGF